MTKYINDLLSDLISRRRCDRLAKIYPVTSNEYIDHVMIDLRIHDVADMNDGKIGEIIGQLSGVDFQVGPDNTLFSREINNAVDPADAHRRLLAMYLTLMIQQKVMARLQAQAAVPIIRPKAASTPGAAFTATAQ